MTAGSRSPSSGAASGCRRRRSPSGSRDGVISGYHARVDPRALGYSLAVVIRVRPAPRELRKVADLARETPEVVECHRITGEDCFFMTAHVRDVVHLEEVIDRFVVFGQTTTSIVQSSPVPARGVHVAP
jgi:Lrp/AsnC family leucine-responsive transcriptional regulator